MVLTFVVQTIEIDSQSMKKKAVKMSHMSKKFLRDAAVQLEVASLVIRNTEIAV